MKSTQVHTVELLAIINKKIRLGRMAGPFNNLPMFSFRCNPVGILPKKMGVRDLLETCLPLLVTVSTISLTLHYVQFRMHPSIKQ